MARTNLLIISAYTFLAGILPCTAQVSGHPGIQQKEYTDPCWGLDGNAYAQCMEASGAVSSCGSLCPFPCQKPIQTPLFNGTCGAPIETCSGRPGNAKCTCNGKGNGPFGEKHTTSE